MNCIKVIIISLVMFLGQHSVQADTQAIPKWTGTWNLNSQWVVAPMDKVPSCGDEYASSVEKLSKNLDSVIVKGKYLYSGDGSATFNTIYSTNNSNIALYKIRDNFFISITLKQDATHGGFLLLNLTVTNDKGNFVCTDGLLARIVKNKTI